MKKYLCKAILICLLFIQCVHEHKIQYNIPPSYPEKERPVLMERLEKGKVLYKEYCSECHGVFTKGKDKVPNFSNSQMDNYSMKFMRKDPKNHAVVAKMSNEQMIEVMSFLRYKRPDNPDSVITRKKPMPGSNK